MSRGGQKGSAMNPNFQPFAREVWIMVHTIGFLGILIGLLLGIGGTILYYRVRTFGRQLEAHQQVIKHRKRKEAAE